MEKRRCVVCRKTFTPTGRVRDQRFCALPECQKERRRRGQKKKRRRDEDYQENDERAQREWTKKHPGYFKAYRESHPDYTEKNLQQQRQRDAKRREAAKKKDVEPGGIQMPKGPLESGTYELRLANSDVLVNEDSIKVKIAVLSAT